MRRRRTGSTSTRPGRGRTGDRLQSVPRVQPGPVVRAVEARGDSLGVDWYRYGHATTARSDDHLSAPSVHGTFSTFVTDSLAWTGTTYALGPGLLDVRPGFPRVSRPRVRAARSERRFHNRSVQERPGWRAARDHDLQSGGALRDAVLDGYASELPADAHEDDNSCNAGRPPSPTLQSPFRDTLTIENPHDVDWIRFHYAQGGLGSTARVRMHAFPGVHPDSLKDLDLYIVSGAATERHRVCRSCWRIRQPGSDVNRTPALATGDTTSWSSTSRDDDELRGLCRGCPPPRPGRLQQRRLPGARPGLPPPCPLRHYAPSTGCPPADRRRLPSRRPAE